MALISDKASLRSGYLKLSLLLVICLWVLQRFSAHPSDHRPCDVGSSFCPLDVIPWVPSMLMAHAASNLTVGVPSTSKTQLSAGLKTSLVRLFCLFMVCETLTHPYSDKFWESSSVWGQHILSCCPGSFVVKSLSHVRLFVTPRIVAS